MLRSVSLRSIAAFVLLIALASVAFVGGVGSPTAASQRSDQWSAATLIDPPSGYLTSVSCPTATFCLAVDGNGNFFTYESGVWSSSGKFGGVSVTSISCPTSSFCAAVASDGSAHL